VVIDYTAGELSDELIQTLETWENTHKFVLNALNAEFPSYLLSGWPRLTKPLLSKEFLGLLGIVETGSDVSNLQDERKISTKDSNKFNILVAEDVETNQRIIQEMLELLGHNVDIAENGQVALDKYARGSYALVFMDCQMPVMDGYQSAKAIREFESENNRDLTPILALTAGIDDKDRQRCQEAGMNGYVSKPFTLSDIERHVSGFLGEITRPASNGSPAVTPVDLDNLTHLNESEIFNIAAIESIRDIERQTGKPLLPTIFEGYSDQMEDKLKELEENIDAGDCTALFRTAHAIKSMSANIGAEKVRQLGAQLETEGRNNALVDPKQSLRNLFAAYDEFSSEFEAVIIAQSTSI
jgi:CheY-like chemotaxis protein